MPSSIEIGLLVPEEKIFEGFVIYGHGGHLGHMTSIIYNYIHWFSHPVDASYKIWL